MKHFAMCTVFVRLITYKLQKWDMKQASIVCSVFVEFEEFTPLAGNWPIFGK